MGGDHEMAARKQKRGKPSCMCIQTGNDVFRESLYFPHIKPRWSGPPESG